MKVAVTGASGFVGRALTGHLSDQGTEVTAFCRSEVSLPGATCTIAAGPSEISVEQLVGIDAVVHLAGIAHRRIDDVPSYYEVNTRSTLTLADRAAEAGVSHFLFLSSSKVHGNGSDANTTFRAYDPLHPEDADHYAWSKLEAERRLLETAQAASMSVTALRPPLIVGAKAQGNLRALGRAGRLGVPVPVPNRAVHRSFLLLEDVCVLVGERLDTTGRPFVAELIRSAHPNSVRELVNLIADGDSRHQRLIEVPRRISRVAVSVGKVVRKDLSPLFNSFEIEESSADRISVCRRAKPPMEIEVAVSDQLCPKCDAHSRNSTGDYFENSSQFIGVNRSIGDQS